MLRLGSTVKQVWHRLLRQPDRFVSLDSKLFADPAVTSAEYVARYGTGTSPSVEGPDEGTDPGVDPGSAYAATRSVWGNQRTAVTVIAVSPARPGALVEIEAVAAVPE